MLTWILDNVVELHRSSDKTLAKTGRSFSKSYKHPSIVRVITQDIPPHYTFILSRVPIEFYLNISTRVLFVEYIELNVML